MDRYNDSMLDMLERHWLNPDYRYYPDDEEYQDDDDYYWDDEGNEDE